MGRAITILSFLVLFSFAFVFYHLWTRRPASAATPRGSAQIMETREDGSVYAVGAELDRFERRLVEEEKRWVKLQTELEALRKERTELQKTVEELQGDVRRLRRQVNERPAGPSEPRPTPPPDTGPVGSIVPEGDGTVPPTPTPGR